MPSSFLAFILITLLFLLNCIQYTKYIPVPDKDIEDWVNNFYEQRSFSYKYELLTKSVYTEAEGNCVVGLGEHVRGMWGYSDSELKFEYIGLGDIEYSKKNGSWQESPRGEESDIFTQINRLLEFDKFEYMDLEREYTYRFKANIPFLAPGRWKEMIGLLKISNKIFLPEVIWAGLPDSSVYCEIKLYNYNKKQNIRSPVSNGRSYLLAAAGDYSRAINKRLGLIGIDYCIKREGKDIILTVPKQYDIEDVRKILACGVSQVYGLTQNKTAAEKIGYLRGETDAPLYLTDKLLNQNDIKDAQIKFDAVSRPYIQITLKAKSTLPSEIAFEVDGTVIAIATLDTSQKIDRITLYTDMRYQEKRILRGLLLQPLPVIDSKAIIEEHH